MKVCIAKKIFDKCGRISEYTMYSALVSASLEGEPLLGQKGR